MSKVATMEVGDGFCPLLNALRLRHSTPSHSVPDHGYQHQMSSSKVADFLFERARAEIGIGSLPPLAVPKAPKAYTGSHQRPSIKRADEDANLSSWVDINIRRLEREWFDHSDGFAFANVTVGNTSAVVAYLRIYKSGNNDIREGLWAAAGPLFGKERGRKYVDQSRDMSDSIYHFLSVWLPRYRRAFPGQPLRMFTLVREPMSHFNSGLREFIFRVFRHSERGQGDKADAHTRRKMASQGMFSEQQVRVLLTAMINGTALYNHADVSNAVYHAFPQVARMFSTGETLLIGRLESYADSITDIGRHFGLSSFFNVQTARGAHLSSQDPDGVGAALNALLVKDPRYQRSLCWLLLPDYACLGYTLPPQCDGIGVTEEKLKQLSA